MVMENDQSTQQSTEAGDSKLASSSRRRVGLPDRISSLLQFLKRAPWLIWAGLWLLLAATSVVAIFSLTHTSFVAQKDLRSATPRSTLPSVKTPAKTTQPTPLQKPVKIPSGRGTSLVLLLIGAAIICTVGYFIVFTILFTPSSGKTRQRVRESSRRRHNRQQRQRLLQASNPPIIVTPEPEENVPAPEPETENRVLNNASIEPLVTILPPETSEPLDVEVSLAEMMDIRKHRSLSSILEENVEQESKEEK